jgi:hypothetical protein
MGLKYVSSECGQEISAFEKSAKDRVVTALPAANH